MDKRTILAIGLIILVIGAYNLVIIPKFSPPPPAPVEQVEAPSPASSSCRPPRRLTSSCRGRQPARRRWTASTCLEDAAAKAGSGFTDVLPSSDFDEFLTLPAYDYLS